MTSNDLARPQSSHDPELGLVTAQPESSQPKRRRLRACDGCRQRKIRCDANIGSCRNCEVYRTECVITRDGVVTLRADADSRRYSDHVQTINPRKRPAAAIQEYDQPQESSSEGQSRTAAYVQAHPQQEYSPSGLYQNSNEIEARIAQSPSLVTTDASPNGPALSTSSSYPSKAEKLQGVVMIGPGRLPKKSKYAGMSSGQVLAKSAEELFKDLVPQVDVMKFFCPLMSFAEEISLNPAHSTPLVDKVLADRAVNNYFSTFHLLFPILDRQAFSRIYEEFYRTGQSDDAPQAACILLVIALGSSDDQENNPQVRSSHFSAAWALYGHLISTPYLSSVQALILLTLELLGSHKDGQAVLAIGVAVRIAQSLGLHRSLNAHTHPHEKEFISKEQNLRSYLWWTCYCLDKKLCFEGGRPSAIFDEDCDADMPNFHVGVLSISSVKHSVRFLPSFIELCKIISNISSNLFSRGISQQPEEVLLNRITALDENLLAWKQSLSSELQPDQELAGVADGMTLMGAALLHCVYNNVMIVIHRAALLGDKSLEMRRHPNPRIVASDIICLGAARSLARLVNDLISEKPGSPLTRWVTAYSMNAVFVLYIGIMKSPRRWSCETDLTLMQSVGSCLSYNKTDARAIGKFNELVSSLCAAVETVRRTVPTASKRQFGPAIQSRLNAATNSSKSSSGPSQVVGNSGMEGPVHSELLYGTRGGMTSSPQNHIPSSQSLSEMLGDNGSMVDPNFHFGDFFGDDPNALNMQFWPTDTWTLTPGSLPGDWVG